MADEKLQRVRTGPSSYLLLNDADAKAWREANTEYGAAESKAQDAPAENKAKSAPAEKKAQG